MPQDTTHALDKASKVPLRSRRANDYRIGDLVAIRETEFDVGYKVRKKFVGPNEVIEILPHNRYKVKKIGTGEGPEQTMTAADSMKYWPGSCPGGH
uniref:DUF5641 domain-containing protein n=1 Tax=Phlebotomus papatasi TaxID=29031 RepID=A0A1B0DPU8_PHLPP